MSPCQYKNRLCDEPMPNLSITAARMLTQYEPIGSFRPREQCLDEGVAGVSAVAGIERVDEAVSVARDGASHA